jgi:hypothetical protein
LNKKTILLFFFTILLCGNVLADNVRPAYLGIEKDKDDKYQVVWKNPLKNGEPLPIEPVLPEAFQQISPITVSKTSDALIQKWTVSIENPEEETISIEGLEATVSDVLFRIKFQDGEIFRSVIRPNNPDVTIQKLEKEQVSQESIISMIFHTIDSSRFFVLLLFVAALSISPEVRKRSVTLCAMALILGSVSGFLIGSVSIEQVSALNSIPDEAETSQILHGLLLNTYRSFSHVDEEAAYDQMSRSVSGDLLTDVYLQNRDMMRIDEKDQSKVYVDRLDIREVESLSSEGGGFSALVTWDVYGSVNHWEHIHYRCNSYKAKITLMPENKYWIITKFDILDEERIM